MKFTNVKKQLDSLLALGLDSGTWTWLQGKLETLTTSPSGKDLYMTYSLLSSKLKSNKNLDLSKLKDSILYDYLRIQKATPLELARMYTLLTALESDEFYYEPKVANLIQVADTSELETFLKYLVLLPNPANYKLSAVEALRTNVATVFDAISANNPYPAEYFNDQQWNQMYLKAAFMQQDLSKIRSVDERANADLARIISDYAHERWAASRKVDPMFWRPVGRFLDKTLLKDMERLLESDDIRENRAGALCCHLSDLPGAKSLLAQYPKLRDVVDEGAITWTHLADGSTNE